MEKNAKNKKKTWHFSKSFPSYLHNWSTLEHNLNRFWKLQFRATTFIVVLFLEFGHVTTLPMTSWLDPDRYNHLYVLFLHFLARNHQYFPFWTSTPGPWMHHPTILARTPNFFPIIPVFHLNVSIFGNACWTLETVLSQHHHQSIPIFFWFFLYFIAIFHPKKHCFPHLEVCTGPWNNTPPSWESSLHFFSNFFTILLIFFIQHSHTFHIWKYALDPEHNAQHGHQLFPIFSQIFLLFFIQHSHTFHLWKCTLDPENCAQQCYQQWAPLEVVWLQTLVMIQ